MLARLFSLVVVGREITRAALFETRDPALISAGGGGGFSRRPREVFTRLLLQ